MCRTLLGIAGLTLLCFFCGTGSAQPKDAALPKGMLPRFVTGEGQTVETAKKAAVTKAIGQVHDLMERNNLITFKLSDEYVHKHVLNGEGEAGKDIDAALPGVDPFKVWVVTFRTDNDWWKDIQHRDHDAQRQHVATSRRHLGSQVIIGLAMLLLAGVGYIRLDDYTQRRYTTWLRLGGAAAVAALGAGWWMFVQAP